jgi:hypothetical protein
MRRELGLEPSARLQSVYRAILADVRPDQLQTELHPWPGSGALTQLAR